jgi:hypothetical protein
LSGALAGLLLTRQTLLAQRFRPVNRMLVLGLIFLPRNWGLYGLLCEAFHTGFRLLAI